MLWGRVVFVMGIGFVGVKNRGKKGGDEEEGGLGRRRRVREGEEEGEVRVDRLFSEVLWRRDRVGGRREFDENRMVGNRWMVVEFDEGFWFGN